MSVPLHIIRELALGSLLVLPQRCPASPYPICQVTQEEPKDFPLAMPFHELLEKGCELSILALPNEHIRSEDIFLLFMVCFSPVELT